MAKNTSSKPLEAKVYSVTGSFDPSDFRFYQTTAENAQALFDKQEGVAPFRKLPSVVLREYQGYTGTNGTAMSPEALKVAQTAGEKNPANPNPGAQDIASLDGEHDTLVVVGHIRFARKFDDSTVSDSPAYTAHHKAFVDAYLSEGNLPVLLRRYLENLANGRLLWRNQYGFSRKTVLTLKTAEGAESFYLTSEKDADFERLVEKVTRIAETPKSYFLLEIALSVELGHDAEVYPSQPFLQDKDAARPNAKSYGRVLSSRPDQNGQNQVILTSQKIGNAFRTVDSWYAEDADVEPIAVEVYGAVPTRRAVLRPEKTFYELFKKNYEDLSEADRHFVMAVLIKGGLLAPASK